MKQISIRMPDEIWEKISHAAIDERKTINQLMIDCTVAHIEAA